MHLLLPLPLLSFYSLWLCQVNQSNEMPPLHFPTTSGWGQLETAADSRQLTLGTELKGQPAKCLERALDTAVCLRTITAPAPPGALTLLRHLQ